MMVHTLTCVSPAPPVRAGWGNRPSIIFLVTTPLHIKYLRLTITGLYKSTFTSTQQQCSSVATSRFVVVKNQRE